MATLAPSLKRIFNELDDTWPKRDRRTDGWYRNCRWVDHGTDHCPTSDGMVHAIDIDKDGINADFVVSRLTEYGRVVRYVIWNRHIWHNRDGFIKRPYSGTPNPHTDHIHVSIEHTDYAEQYSGGYGIGVGRAPGAPMAPGIPAANSAIDQASDMGRAIGHVDSLSGSLAGYAKFIRGLRNH